MEEKHLKWLQMMKYSEEFCSQKELYVDKKGILQMQVREFQ